MRSRPQIACRALVMGDAAPMPAGRADAQVAEPLAPGHILPAYRLEVSRT